MKRTRRVSVVIEHRELTISLTRTSAPEVPAAGREPGHAEAANPAPFPARCPQCASPWVTVTAQSGEGPSAATHAVQHALEQRGLHLLLSPTGEFRICSKSLEEIRCEEARSEETKESF